MKTVQVMERDLEGSIIRQNHKNGYLNLNDLEKAGNRIRENNDLPRKKIADYFQTKETKEFLNQVALEEGLTLADLRVVKKGRNGSQYAHPLIFLDVAMWFSPEFKVKVLKWFYDNLLMFRDNSGDSFKAMNKALDRHFEMKTITYIQVARHIADVCGVPPCESKNRWNSATPEQLALRNRIQNNVALLADMSADMNIVIKKAVEKAGISSAENGRNSAL